MKRVDKLVKECDPYLRNYIRALKEVSDGWERLTKDAVAKLRQPNNNTKIEICHHAKVKHIKCQCALESGDCARKECDGRGEYTKIGNLCMAYSYQCSHYSGQTSPVA